jgi:carboxymethylenebutenolidase
VATGLRTEKVRADGGTFDAHLTVPEQGHGPGIVLLQEIFGVNDYIKGSAAKLAALGYVVLCPDVFWRIEPNVALPHTEASLATAFGYVSQFDAAQGIADCCAALAHLRTLSEVDDGRAGVMGFCLGGSLAYGVATHGDPDTAVSYYGSGIADSLDEADRITCPILLHFGGNDAYIPSDQIERIQARLGSRPGVEIRVQVDAGHAFDNYEAPMFHDAVAAAAAWELTRDFLDRTLPTHAVAR